MGYETPYPEPRTAHPRTPHGNYRIVSSNNMDTKFNYCLFKRCDILVSKYPEVLSALKKWLDRKLTFTTVKGYETPYRK